MVNQEEVDAVAEALVKRVLEELDKRQDVFLSTMLNTIASLAETQQSKAWDDDARGAMVAILRASAGQKGDAATVAGWAVELADEMQKLREARRRPRETTFGTGDVPGPRRAHRR